VTDLPADFEVALQGVDTRLKALQPGTTLGDIAYSSATANTNTRLGIGTAGQVLAVSGGGVPAWTTTADVTPLTTKGDLFTFTTVDARLGVGTNGQTLVADSAEATGLKWATPASGLSLVSTTTYSSQTTVSIHSAFTSTYTNYLVVMNTNSTGAGHEDMSFRLRASGTDTSVNYKSQRLYATGTSSGAGIDVLGTDEIWLGITSPTGVPAAGTSFVLMSPNVAARTTMQGSVGYGLFSSTYPFSALKSTIAV